MTTSISMYLMKQVRTLFKKIIIKTKPKLLNLIALNHKMCFLIIQSKYLDTQTSFLVTIQTLSLRIRICSQIRTTILQILSMVQSSTFIFSRTPRVARRRQKGTQILDSPTALSIWAIICALIHTCTMSLTRMIEQRGSSDWLRDKASVRNLNFGVKLLSRKT